MCTVNCRNPLKETGMLVLAVPQIEERRNGISFLNCSHRFMATILWMLCKQSGNCIETFVLKQITLPGVNVYLFFNSYCRTVRSVVQCVGTILFLDCYSVC